MFHQLGADFGFLWWLYRGTEGPRNRALSAGVDVTFMVSFFSAWTIFLIMIGILEVQYPLCVKCLLGFLIFWKVQEIKTFF